MKQRSKNIVNFPVKLWYFTEFLFFYLKELILANFKLAYDLLKKDLNMQPAIVEVDLEITKDIEILTLVNLITMTPGSLSLDLSPDRKKLYVHALYVSDIEKTRSQIKTGLEKRVLKLYR